MIIRLDCNGNTTAEWLRAMADMEHQNYVEANLTVDTSGLRREAVTAADAAGDAKQLAGDTSSVNA